MHSLDIFHIRWQQIQDCTFTCRLGMSMHLTARLHPFHKPVVCLDSHQCSYWHNVDKDTWSALLFNQSIFIVSFLYRNTEMRISYTCVSSKYQCTATSGNVPSDVRTQRIFRSDCAFAQSDQILPWAQFGLAKMQSVFIRTTKILIRLRNVHVIWIFVERTLEGTYSHVEDPMGLVAIWRYGNLTYMYIWLHAITIVFLSRHDGLFSRTNPSLCGIT